MFAENSLEMDKKNETINDQILNLVNESLSNPKSNKRIQIGSVSPKLAAKVLKVTGIDIKGFKLVMDAGVPDFLLGKKYKKKSTGFDFGFYAAAGTLYKK